MCKIVYKTICLYGKLHVRYSVLPIACLGRGHPWPTRRWTEFSPQPCHSQTPTQQETRKDGRWWQSNKGLDILLWQCQLWDSLNVSVGLTEISAISKVPRSERCVGWNYGGSSILSLPGLIEGNTWRPYLWMKWSLQWYIDPRILNGCVQQPLPQNIPEL